MKKAGWIVLILGCLSFLGCISAGSNPIGPTFWIALGIYLLYRAKQKEQKKDDEKK